MFDSHFLLLFQLTAARGATQRPKSHPIEHVEPEHSTLSHGSTDDSEWLGASLQYVRINARYKRSLVAHPSRRDNYDKGEKMMVEKCANPCCDFSFRYFGRGRLFAFEVRRPASPCQDVPRTICEKHPSHATVCFWLCEECARNYVVEFTVATGMHLVALPATALNGNAIPEMLRHQELQHGGRIREAMTHAIRCSDDEVLAGIAQTTHSARR